MAAQAGDIAIGATARQARPRSRWREMWRALARNHLAAFGAIVAAIYVVAALVGPRFAPYPYDQQDLLNANLPPFSPGHLLGTDQIGRDMLSRLIMGIRISLEVGIGVTVISVAVGGLAGAIAGYYRGRIDTLISGVVEFAWGFPLILLAVILAGAMGPGLRATVLAIGLVNWAGFARIVRGEVLGLREAEFVQAAQAIGLRDRDILWRHIMPNVVPPTLVMASYYVALAIVIEAGLSFIGMGAQPPLPSLGVMIAEGRNYMFQNPWVTTIPGLAILLVVLALNFLGDGLRDALDPRLRGR
ncbi:MAG TPA: ABC transporter permease [Thermomicrobiales bacterium]|nr:ABC transporter permease [Thermomicrobiales bacterium]